MTAFAPQPFSNPYHPHPHPHLTLQPPGRTFVRARFSFTASDPSALSFHAGDVIEVITRLESGWWDGMLGLTRGWFPSNFVEEVEEDSDLDASEEWDGEMGLDDLAREMMGRQDEESRGDSGGAGGGGDDEDGDDGRLDGGGRTREGTDRTVVGLQPSAMPRPDGLGVIKGEERKMDEGELEDAWVPSLTPEGQVYYHNTQTGEDLWEIPLNTPSLDEDYDEEEDRPPTTLPSDRSSTELIPDSPHDDVFQPPPKAKGDIPAPWAARLSDDGREWYYFNRLTKETRKDLPRPEDKGVHVVDLGEDVSRLSVVSSSRRPARESVEIRRKAVDDWTRHAREALQPIFKTPDKPTMGILVDNVNDALREIFEAAVAGSAAQEELSRAHDLRSESGMSAAVLREDGAREMLASAKQATLVAIRDLLRSCGYVGPLDRMEEMPRPAWTGDLTLIGNIGLLSANVHAAVTSRRTSETAGGHSVWQEVLRSASKLKDTISGFPRSAFPNVPAAGLDQVVGRRLEAWLSVEGSGEGTNGRWGFGKTEDNLRPLEQSTLIEVQRLKADFDIAARPRSGEEILPVLRLASRFGQLLDLVDIASSVDVDGETGAIHGDERRKDDAEAYEELVEQGRQALRDLDAARAAMSSFSTLLFIKLAAGSLKRVYDDLISSADAAFVSLSNLLIVSQEQKAIVDSGIVRGQIGQHSPLTLTARHDSIRPESMLSGRSRHSRRSEMEALRQRVRGLDEEFLDQEEERDRAGSLQSASASASQTSLPGQNQKAKGGELSATSSSTSLAYQVTESDSGSNKGNRSSFMKFMRGRSSSETDDGRGTARAPKPPNRKLAKLLGEDMQSLPTIPGPPPPPEPPWFLKDDYEPGEIVFDDRGVVKAGTLRALVARLTPHTSTDTAFFQAFLLTFRSFTSGKELLQVLFDRYHIAPPGGMNPAEALDWKKMKQTPIRLRVSNTIRSWLDVHYIEAEDLPVLDRVADFARTTLLANGSELLSKQLLALVQRRQQGEGDSQRRIISGGMLSPPAPLLPRVPPGRELRVTDIAPLELARQLTILEFGYFQKIKPVECLNKAWNQEDGEKRAPNVRSVIHTANVLSGWVVVNVLSSRDVKTRAGVIKYFVQTALELRNLNNFSSIAAIAAGLNSAPITRLKRTKDVLNQKTVALKADLDKTLDSTRNFSYYKDMLKTINPPCVPFFGFWLSALTFIEDGNKDYVYPTTTTNGMPTSISSSSLASGPPANGHGNGTGQPLINFFKRSLSAEILRDIQQYQFQPYNLARCKPVSDFIMRGLEATDKRRDDVYEISLQLEPREKEEERITRMLHDSGFI